MIHWSVQVSPVLKKSLLTSLLCADGDIGKLFLGSAQAWHSIQSLDFECVVNMRHKVLDHHRGACEARGFGYEAHVAVACLAGLAISSASETEDIIAYILPTTWVAGRSPLQKEGGLIDVKYQVSRRGGRSWKKRHTWLISNHNYHADRNPSVREKKKKRLFEQNIMQIKNFLSFFRSLKNDAYALTNESF